jgi:hypothetical protein
MPHSLHSISSCTHLSCAASQLATTMYSPTHTNTGCKHQNHSKLKITSRTHLYWQTNQAGIVETKVTTGYNVKCFVTHLSCAASQLATIM